MIHPSRSYRSASRINQLAKRLSRRLQRKRGLSKRWARLVAAMIIAGSGLAATPAAARAQSDPPPNVVFILADDMGWTDANTFGSDYYQTPNIDALRAQSTALMNFLACPNCAPARARLLSGMYEGRTDVYAVGNPSRGDPQFRQLDGANQDFLDTSVQTLPEQLQSGGYATGHFGKWHLSSSGGGALPTGQGFDVNIGGTNSGGGGGAVDSHFADGNGKWQDLSNATLPDSTTGGDLTGSQGEYLADRLTDDAIDWMDDRNNSGDGPFFSYLSHYAVHWPIEAKQSDIDQYDGVPAGSNHDNPEYGAMITNLDENIGRVVDYLETTDDLSTSDPNDKLIDNTIIWFTSDNGGVFEAVLNADPAPTSNSPLRDGKASMYEGGVRVPSMVRWDGHVAAGGTSDVRTSLLDVMPTLLSMTGAPAPTGQPMDGADISGLLDGSATDLGRNGLHYMHYPAYVPLTQNGSEMRITPSSAVWEGDWKLIYTYETQAYELYNLANDLGETTNLANDNPDKVNDLRQKLNDWLVDTDADLPTYKGTNTEVPLPVEFTVPDESVIFETAGPIALSEGDVIAAGAGDVSNDAMDGRRVLVITYDVALTASTQNDGWLALGMGFDGVPPAGAQATDVIGFNSTEESDAGALVRTDDSGDPAAKDHKLWIGGNTDPNDDISFADVVADGQTGKVRLLLELSEAGIMAGESADIVFEVDEDGDGTFDVSAESTMNWTDAMNYLWFGSRGGASHAVSNFRVARIVGGDANLDGDVDVFQFDGGGDAQILGSKLGTTSGARWTDGDFNGDGDVDVFQFDGQGDAQILGSNLTGGASDLGDDAASGTAELIYDVTTGRVWIDVGGDGQIAVVGLELLGAAAGQLMPDNADALNGQAVGQATTSVLAYYNFSGLPDGEDSVGLVLPPGLSGSDIGFGYTPIGGESVQAPIAIVPEPTTVVLVGLGGILLAGRRRR